MPDFTIIGRYNDSISAHLAKSKLESEGIECFLQDEILVNLRRGVNDGIKLLVNDFDAEKASNILQINQYKKLRKAYPKKMLQSTICPKCFSGDVSHPTSFLAILAFLLVYAPPFIQNPKKNICKHCGFKWKSEK